VASGVVAVAAFLTVLLLRDNGNSAELENAQAVHCLAVERRADFLRAASDLRLGDPVSGAPDQVRVGSRTMALRDWRVDGEAADGFREACAAFAAATKGPAAGGAAGGGNTVLTFLLALLTALVPVGLTAWLGYLTTVRKDAEAARRSRTDAVRAAALRFGQAAEAYLRVRTSSAEIGTDLLAAMHERRLELAAALAPVAAAVPGWDQPRALRTRLETDLRGDVVGRAGRIDDGLAQAVRAKVDELVSEAEVVAAEHESRAAVPGTAGNKQVKGS